MRTLSDSLFDLSIYFTFLLFIIFSFQHFLLLFTFLEASRQQPCALPLRSRVPQDYKFSSTEETEWQERFAREAAWRLAKSVLKEKNKATFFSPSENRCLPASTLKPEEREFVVDSGASMHMISQKDLIFDAMDTLTTSYSPTIVLIANGEVQTHSVRQRIGYILDKESPRGYASSFIARKALRRTWILI